MAIPITVNYTSGTPSVNPSGLTIGVKPGKTRVKWIFSGLPAGSVPSITFANSSVVVGGSTSVSGNICECDVQHPGGGNPSPQSYTLSATLTTKTATDTLMIDRTVDPVGEGNLPWEPGDPRHPSPGHPGRA